MYKKIGIAFMVGCLSLLSYAQDITTPPNIPKETGRTWTFLRIGILPDFPESPAYGTYGLVLGIPASGGKGSVDGLEAAVILASTNNVRGVQGSFIVNITKKITGLQGSIINIAEEKTTGLQAGLTNITGDVDGLQFSAVNVATGAVDGSQIGVVNVAEEANGLQIGVFNVAQKSGFQIGLINFISDNWLQFSFLVNASFN